MRFQPASFRPAFGRVLTITIALIALGALIGYGVAGDIAGLLRSGWWLVLLAAVTWALYWMPAVEVLEHEVIVRNPLSTWHVPWPAIERIDTKWALTLFTPRGKIEAWAAPASGRYTVFTLGPEDTRVTETARLAGSNAQHAHDRAAGRASRAGPPGARALGASAASPSCLSSGRAPRRSRRRAGGGRRRRSRAARHLPHHRRHPAYRRREP
ncbi:MAG: hypothetical protein B7Y93_04385 [Micrococcales bacterium 32-70-13]|nr:MAG: hypothetical protein B7Y93_04385 [Micrococcales bacterium 32-70-13]